MKSLTNNFDFLRLSAAMMVLYSHQFALLGHAQPTALLGVSFGELGVCIFFSISGYLVTQSWTRDPNVIRFAAKRVLRIWPGLFIATCFGALVIGLIATDLPWLTYLRSPEMHGYFTSLRMKMQFSLPGVFLGIPFPHAVNGSLWTIPLEVSCYIALLIAGILRVTSFRWITLLGVVCLALYFFGTDRSGIDVIANYRLQYGLFFGAGACMWLFRECWATRRFVGTLLLLAGAAVAIWSRQYMIACLLMVPYASVVIGEASTPVLRRFGRFGDLSYGVYIYAFPAQQTLIWATHAHLPFAAYLAGSVVSTLMLAYASWHLVERPALRLKPNGAKTNGSQVQAGYVGLAGKD